MIKNIIYRIFGKPVAPEDTGLRGTIEGRLYVDKKVFYKRREVIDAIEKIKNSKVIRDMINKHKVCY